MKGIRGSTKHEVNFIGCFNRLCNGHNAWQVWRDFINISACAIANAVDHRRDVWQLREDIYLDTIKKYSREEQKLLCEMFGVTVLALEENPSQDFLGKFYMRLDFGRSWHGQFFTPWHIAEFMAKMQIGDELKEQIKSNGYISINDPCCGAGCMLMAFANACKSDTDINYQQSVFFVGQDIDPIVAKMGYIQISLLGCPGYILVGDSILEPICGNILEPTYKRPEDLWFTPLYFTDIWSLRRIEFENTNRQKTEEEQKSICMPMKEENPKTVQTLQKSPQIPVVKNQIDKKKTFSWKDFFTIKGKGKK